MKKFNLLITLLIMALVAVWKLHADIIALSTTLTFLFICFSLANFLMNKAKQNTQCQRNNGPYSSCNTEDHSIECLYEFTISTLGLTDTPEMRVLFWDMHGKLEWDESKDAYLIPEFTHTNENK